MKAKSRMSPAVITSLVLVAMLLVVGVIGFVSGGGQGDAPLADDGPNAGLSNEELLSKAISNTNVKAVQSIHAEVSGYFFYYDSPGMRYFFDDLKDSSIIADVQWTKNQMRIEVRPIGGSASESMVMLEASDGKTYLSTDGGRTWSIPRDVSGGLGMALVPPLTVFWQDGAWGQMWGIGGQGAEETPASGEQSKSLLSEFEDGTPLIEKLDGVVTRHLVAKPEPEGNGPKVETLDVWVSTDMTPTLRQVVMRGTVDQETIDKASSRGIVKAGPYTSTWTWSRFGEDFGEVKPPAADAIREP